MTTTVARQEVRDLLERIADAWNRGDADAYGAEFTEDAGYITWLGTLYQGRRDIVESHRAMFGGFLKGTRMYSETVDIRFVAPETVVVTTRGDIGKKPPKKHPKVQTFTVVRKDGRWQVAAFQNTKRKPLMEAMGFRAAPATRPPG